MAEGLVGVLIGGLWPLFLEVVQLWAP